MLGSSNSDRAGFVARHLAGNFALRHEYKNHRQDAGATKRASATLLFGCLFREGNEFVA